MWPDIRDTWPQVKSMVQQFGQWQGMMDPSRPPQSSQPSGSSHSPFETFGAQLFSSPTMPIPQDMQIGTGPSYGMVGHDTTGSYSMPGPSYAAMGATGYGFTPSHSMPEASYASMGGTGHDFPPSYSMSGSSYTSEGTTSMQIEPSSSSFGGFMELLSTPTMTIPRPPPMQTRLPEPNAGRPHRDISAGKFTRSP